MATKPSLVATLIVTLMLMVNSSRVIARPLNLMKPTVDSPSPSPSLVYHLGLDEADEGYCWDSLMQLQHCSGELIMFFLNGETYIGPGCCGAIRTVGKKCWPTMVGVLGFTPQEGDILQGSCDDQDDNINNGYEHDIASSRLAFSVKFKPTTFVETSNP